MNKRIRIVYRVFVMQTFTLDFVPRQYVGVDRCFTSKRAAHAFYRNLIRHSDYADQHPIYSTGFLDDICLSVGYFSDYQITSFHLTSKVL